MQALDVELNTSGFSQELQQRLLLSSARLNEIIARSKPLAPRPKPSMAQKSVALEAKAAEFQVLSKATGGAPATAMHSASSSDSAGEGIPSERGALAHVPKSNGMPPMAPLKAEDMALSSFTSHDSPLFEEYLELLGPGLSPAATAPIGPNDALLVIDMQADFVPKDGLTNPDGGRFGVSEGEKVVPLCCHLIDHFVKQGASVVATRDYHPVDHCSFLSQGGPFPAHCIQGTAGSHLLPPIAAALEAGLLAGGGRRWPSPSRRCTRTSTPSAACRTSTAAMGASRSAAVRRACCPSVPSAAASAACRRRGRARSSSSRAACKLP